MNTKEQLSQELKDAMRAKDAMRKSVIRLTLAAIKNAEISQNAELDEPAVLAIIQKEVKARHETIEGAEQARRDDLIAEAKAEIAILEGYLPQALSAAELEALVKESIAEAGATSAREMGAVMQILMPKVRGRADGKQASQLVRKFLA